MVRRLAVAYLVVDLIHFGDHLRQGRTLRFEIYSLGTLGLVAAIVVVALALGSHPLTALAATFFGFAAAAGLVAVHLAPPWGRFSDSYQALSLDLLSWAIVVVQVAVAAALGLAGLAELSRRGRTSAA